jgi:hypothetical protein
MSDRPGGRPRRATVVLGLLAGLAFILVGLLITASTFGAPGVCWTLVAGTVLAFYGAPLFGGAGGFSRRTRNPVVSRRVPG